MAKSKTQSYKNQVDFGYLDEDENLGTNQNLNKTTTPTSTSTPNQPPQKMTEFQRRLAALKPKDTPHQQFIDQFYSNDNLDSGSKELLKDIKSNPLNSPEHCYELKKSKFENKNYSYMLVKTKLRVNTTIDIYADPMSRDFLIIDKGDDYFMLLKQAYISALNACRRKNERADYSIEKGDAFFSVEIEPDLNAVIIYKNFYTPFQVSSTMEKLDKFIPPKLNKKAYMIWDIIPDYIDDDDQRQKYYIRALARSEREKRERIEAKEKRNKIEKDKIAKERMAEIVDALSKERTEELLKKKSEGS